MHAFPNPITCKLLRALALFGFVSLAIKINAAQLRDYAGVPEPTASNPQLSASSGDFVPWPGWDPYNISTPAKPSSWPSDDKVGYYYVEPDHPSAKDSKQSGDLTDASGNRYGYPNRPRATMPGQGSAGSYDIPAGTYIEFNGEMPDRGEGIKIRFLGTSANPCWVTGNGIYHTGRWQLGGSSHAIIEGITFGLTDDKFTDKNNKANCIP